MALPVRFLYSTHAGCGSATQTGRPSTRNLISTASAWRVAMATIKAWYRQCAGFFLQRSVAVKSVNIGDSKGGTRNYIAGRGWGATVGPRLRLLSVALASDVEDN